MHKSKLALIALPALCLTLISAARQTLPAEKPATQPVDAGPTAKLPYTFERFEREGPVHGVLVKLDLSDSRVSLQVALADSQDPDGEGKAVGKLATVSAAAMKQDFEIAMNASFFAVTASKTILGKKVGYYVGNGGYPVGWHYSGGRLVSAPSKDNLRSTLVVHKDGRVTLDDKVAELPTDVKYAVSGNATPLRDGVVVPAGTEDPRHPRSAVGITADGKTLLLMVVDGRREGWSRGVSIHELGELMKDFGADDAVNLDGGGSSSLVVKDQVTGAFSVTNRPSERYALDTDVNEVERPVVDLVGVQIDMDAK